MSRPRLMLVSEIMELDNAPSLPIVLDAERPQRRGDCLPGGPNEQRPCPFISCKHHLYLAVSGEKIRLNFPHIAPDELELMPETCALDAADQGGMTLEEVGEMLGVTRERARQLEERLRDSLVRYVRKEFGD